MRRLDEALRAYLYLGPALAVMALCGVVPMVYILDYSLHDTFSGNDFIWVGAQWYEQLLTSPTFWGAILRSACFSALVLSIEIPLGIFIALRLPPRG